MKKSTLYDAVEDYIVELRRWFHAHAEISLQEKETSEKIKKELREMGIVYEEMKTNYGIVATIEGTRKGNTIAIRADMDALPIKEETGLSFASSVEGVMHACGHDAHMAMLLGAAKVLNQIKEELKGTVKLIFQPAEEIRGGLDEILSFLEENGGVQEVIGLHVWSSIPEGEILLIPGAVFAGGKGFKCTIRGQGGHGARPDLVKDPIKAACELVLKFSAIPVNFYDVLDHAVVSVGMIHAGTLENIFPTEAVVKGSTRYYKAGGQKKIEAAMHQIAEGVGQMYGVQVKLEFDGGVIPIKNDADMIIRAKKIVGDVPGLEISAQTDPICASDNFCYAVDRYKGFYGVLGVGKKGSYLYPQHHSQFDIEERALRKGTEFMTRYVRDFLG